MKTQLGGVNTLICPRHALWQSRARSPINNYIYITPRVNHYTNQFNDDYYKILGVSKNASTSDIKIAYFTQAKKCHPDVCPNDPVAMAKFKKVSEAYSILKDPSMRRSYDQHRASPFSRGTYTDSQQGYGGMGGSSAGGMGGVDAEEIFKAVWKDLGMHELKDYLNNVQEEGLDAIDSIRQHNDFAPAWSFAKEYKGLIAGVVLPVALTLRFPALVALALRNVFMVPVLIMRALPADLRWQLMHEFWWKLVKIQEKHAKQSYTKKSSSSDETKRKWGSRRGR
eukprot:CFRG3595T1